MVLLGPDGRFEKIKSIAIGEGTNATEREENQVSWNLFNLSISYLNAAKIKSDVNLVVVNSRESSQPERRRRRVGSIQFVHTVKKYELCFYAAWREVSLVDSRARSCWKVKEW